jgi:hypothetical protein
VFITNPANIKTRYTPIIIDKPGLIMNSEIISENTIRNYSTTIYRDTGDMVYKEIVASSHPIAVYLNGIMLYKGTPTGGTAITYPFKKGSNLLEVITTISGAPTTCSVDLNLPLTSIGSTICANEAPMTPVSLFDLRYNTNNQLNVYTLLTANDKYTVIVKDPDLAIRYEMVYDYTIEPINEVLLKAILRREHSSVNITPRLISYEIKFV